MKLYYGFDDLKDIDVIEFLPIILPFVAIGTLLVVIALIDLYRHRETRENVLIWTIIIVCVSTIGPILYFVKGRNGGEKI